MPALAILIRYWRPILALVSVAVMFGGLAAWIATVKHDAYVAGRAAGDAACEKKMHDLEAANKKVTDEAAKKLDELANQLELKDLQVDDILKGIDLAADAAPDATSCGLDADSLRRLNAIN